MFNCPLLPTSLAYHHLLGFVKGHSSVLGRRCTLLLKCGMLSAPSKYPPFCAIVIGRRMMARVVFCQAAGGGGGEGGGATKRAKPAAGPVDVEAAARGGTVCGYCGMVLGIVEWYGVIFMHEMFLTICYALTLPLGWFDYIKGFCCILWHSVTSSNIAATLMCYVYLIYIY